jgi:hypothetical protein
MYVWLQIQFTTAMIMGINGIKSGCDFPLWMQYMLVIYMISFIVLFGNFYAKAYIEKVRSAVRVAVRIVAVEEWCLLGCYAVWLL